jgi:hypothetical protein
MTDKKYHCCWCNDTGELMQFDGIYVDYEDCSCRPHNPNIDRNRMPSFGTTGVGLSNGRIFDAPIIDDGLGDDFDITEGGFGGSEKMSPQFERVMDNMWMGVAHKESVRNSIRSGTHRLSYAGSCLPKGSRL